ncbi:hypothetical protein V6Z12_D12G192800 [Gossypium hirsutum]
MVRDILATYEAASGQSVNFQKYGVLFGSNIIMADRSMVHSVLRVLALLDHGRHLGLPSLIGRNKRQVFGFIRDRLCKRMFNWKNKLLSRPSKEVMLKSIALAVSVYTV